MTVKELKEKLNNYNDNDIIILSSDAEGNDYYPLYAVFQSYVASRGRELDLCDGEFDGAIPCIVISP